MKHSFTENTFVLLTVFLPLWLKLSDLPKKKCDFSDYFQKNVKRLRLEGCIFVMYSKQQPYERDANFRKCLKSLLIHGKSAALAGADGL